MYYTMYETYGELRMTDETLYSFAKKLEGSAWNLARLLTSIFYHSYLKVTLFGCNDNFLQFF